MDECVIIIWICHI